MKKFVAITLVLCLMISCAYAYEKIKMRDLSDEELNDLYTEVREELIKRGAWEGIEIPAGVYYVGMGLPEGTYICTSTYGGGAALVYRNYESFLNGEEYLSRTWITSGHSYQMALNGEICYVLEFPSIARVFQAPSW